MDRDGAGILSHQAIWAAIDGFALRHGLSPSGLARRAGLSATTFNRSKRHGADGRPRWPSTESIAKMLEATGTAPAEFFGLIGAADSDRLPPARDVPLLELREVGPAGSFDTAGAGDAARDGIPLPPASGDDLVAVPVTGNAMLPLYRDGDIVLVAPKCPVRRGDRILLQRPGGDLQACVLVRRTVRFVEVARLDRIGETETIPAAAVAWLARIVWASQ